MAILRQVHIIQLNSYNLDQQIIWYKKKPYELIAITNFPRKQKKKLVFTSRIKRLIVLIIILFIPFFIFRNKVLFVLVTIFSPIIIFIGFYISLPIENYIRHRFTLEAKKILDENKNLYKIAITGSYGKTSVKYYLDKLLRTKYSVCKTPESFNTAMGATLTIKNDLRSYDEIFICEMGARRVGDIKEICEFVNPNSGIITDVGPMHLDTFKTIDNVLKCKTELIDYVDKILLVNGDNELLKSKCKTALRYGKNLDNDYRYANIKIENAETSFDFIDKNETTHFTTKLLGEYNIKNLTAAIAFAKILGIENDKLIDIVKTIEAVDHRLKLIKLDKESYIIDDAYNSNPSGARNAVDVLSGFNDYKKIIITPGMVELGDKQFIENESFANYLNGKVDYALFTSKANREALAKGYKDSLTFDSVNEAIFYARNNINGKKVILLENDLSDNY